MGGPWRHYTKWDKSDQVKQILFKLTYMWNLKKNKNKNWAHKYRDQNGGTRGRGVGETGEGGQKVHTSN